MVNYRDFSSIKPKEYGAVVIGCGFAGSVVARELAERGGKRVLMIEKRSHIGGNMYDEYDDAGILVHRYGPHIFHTTNERAFEYVKRFTEWRNYEHCVLSNWYGTYIPVPFNKNSMELVYGEEMAAELIEHLIEVFGDGRKVPIIELRAQNDPMLAQIADFVYKNVFLYYTQKQWGLTPDEVDPSVTARVPVFISRDNRYFQDPYQGMPADGYTKLFENMLSHENIDVCLNTEAESVFELVFDGMAEDAPITAMKLKDRSITVPIIYTGPLDELFLTRFGRLPYRTLEFKYETYDKPWFQPCGTVNYTVTEDFTRITEFKHLTGQTALNTTIMKEYSLPYTDKAKQIPYYAIISDENRAHYERYLALTANLPNFYPLGRLAEYRYYNMDVIIGRALELADKLLEQ